MREVPGLDDQSPLKAALGLGVDLLSQHQEVCFQAYSRVVLPLDGYVFWLPTVKVKVQGALHHTEEILQNEDETLGSAATYFTTRQKIVEFAKSPINTIFVAREGDVRYAFSSQSGYAQFADLWHYQGRVVSPAMASQLLDDPSQIDPTQVIVSNSLPIWLTLNGYSSPIAGGFSNSGASAVPLFPSFVVPPNLVPPYCAVHIPPESTRALQGVPLITQVTETIAGQEVQVRVHQQLAADRVRLTVYGLQNLAALNFFDSILEVMATGGAMGLMNTPTVSDGKRAQAELQAIAMQKTMEFEVSYNQVAATEAALRLLEQAFVTLNINAQ